MPFQEIVAMASDIRLAIVIRRLATHGCTLDRINGSHHIFIKEGEGHISVPVHKGRVKPGYVRRIERQLGITLR